MIRSLIFPGLASMLMASCALPVFATAEEGGGGGAPPAPLSITDALGKLSIDNSDDWTEAGLPSMARMKELTGNADLTRADVGEAKPGFNRSSLSSEPRNNAENLGGGKTPAGASLAADAVEKQGQSNERLEETGEGDLPGTTKTAEQLAAEAAGSTRAEHEAEVLKGTADDKTTTTAADALRQDRKGEDFGQEKGEQPEPEIPVDSRGKLATDIDVQAVGLEETLSAEEAQAQSAAALAGDNSEQSDYDAGFVRGYELGKTEGAKGAVEEARPEEIPEATREQRNAEVATSSAAPASVDIGAIVAAAGGDAIALCEALVQAAAGDGYKRNSALTSFVRGYMVSQAEIKEVQRRLDIRNEQRASESARQAQGNTTLKA